VGLPRYLAAARVDDLERTLGLADELIAPHELRRAVCLLQCGRPSALAGELAEVLGKSGRSFASLVVKERREAQSEAVLARLAGASAVWVFAEDMLEAFSCVFATQLAFALRARASEGLPVIGVGNGALALGGLLLASRICGSAQYDLVSGLGWAPRVLVDGGADRGSDDGAIARSTVRALPGLLGVDLGVWGGLRVEGGRVESVGREPVHLFGTTETGSLVLMSLAPGQVARIAPPPFAPFERGLLPAETARALTPDRQPERSSATAKPPVPEVAPPPPADDADASSHTAPGSGRVCPMCHKPHPAESRIELAA
jgi:hypothetical protein